MIDPQRLNRERVHKIGDLFLLRYLLIVVLVLLFGFACAPVPSLSDKTRTTPVFASPCSAVRNCGALSPCADTGFETCEAFQGVPGIRRRISGTLGRLDFRAEALDLNSGAPISLWHDVPLLVSDDEKGMVVNAFFEVSRGTHAKVELNKWESHNPMWQDRKDVPGQDFQRPRYYAWSPAPGNYGALPRTWENVLASDPLTGYPGDADPIDVVDVGSAPAPLGIACRVKVIGALGMIDGTDRLTDWKIYVINVKDPRASRINDIADVPQEIRDEWALFWRFYKTPLGLDENIFYAPGTSKGFSDDAVWLGEEIAREVIRNSAKDYRKLLEYLLPKLQRPYWVPGATP